MLRGLSVSVEMNGDLILDTVDIITRPLESTGVHCTSTVTSSLSTVSGSVILHVRVREVPSYSGPLGTLRARVGVGTGGETHTQMELVLHPITTQRPPTPLTSDSDCEWCGGVGHSLPSFCWCE